MSDPALVSVVIRTKDRKELLREAVDSALGQTWPAVEILVVNDGGEDVSSVLPDIPDRPGRTLRTIDIHPGVGRSGAANRGLEEAGGDWLLLLDDDDWIDSGHIEGLMAALEASPGRPAAYSAARTTADPREGGPSFAHPWDRDRLLLENFIPIHAVLFSREAVRAGCRFDPAFDRLEDWDFWLQVSQLGDFLYVDRCTAHYRVSDASGFGARTDEEDDRYRLAVYRKWLPRLEDDALLGILDRARRVPQLLSVAAEVDELKGHLKNREEQVDNLERRHSLEVRDLTARIQRQQDSIDSLRNELDIIYNSRSWKITRPLRYVSTAGMIYRNEGLATLMGRIRQKFSKPRRALPRLGSDLALADSYEPLCFQAPGSPRVSIVIPVYNQYLYTFHCLQAIGRHTEDSDFEIVVVDDCSTDETPRMLEQMSGIRVITHETNKGFIQACNTGARAARGDYLVLLNNDTEVRPGWLQALRRTFADFPEAGLVGARLVYPDGTLQEAGGIIWQDGSGWNVGRGDDPNKPVYSYCREVDYCSGACLMIPRQDFLDLGLFDDYYAPAYYEDTDLAFKVRKAGKSVYYQPMATVVHFEGVTSGTDTDSGVKRYQLVNQERFLQRWGETLRTHRPPGAQPHLERERFVTRRALVIDARVPMPDHDSGSLRMDSILRLLQQLDYKVSFIADNLEYHGIYTRRLQASGVECIYRPYTETIADHLREHGHLYDLVILSRADVAEKAIGTAREYCPHAAVIFDTVDLHFLREQRQGELTGDTAMLNAAGVRRQQEMSIARRSDLTVVVSPAELEVFRRQAPDIPVAMLSNIHTIDLTDKSFAERRDILFIGSFEHPPNVDAVQYFLEEIFPLIRERRPEIRFKVVGLNPPARLRERADDHVEFTGLVTKLKPLFNDIRLSVAPLRYGAGVKGKINSSMAYGVPVVASTVAAEGMGLTHGEDILVADTPADFTEQVLRAYDDQALWASLREAGGKNIEQHFSFDVARRQLREILERVDGVEPAA